MKVTGEKNGKFVHGGYLTREFGIWRAMKQRCMNPKCHIYPNYGGRGIVMCAEWAESFSAFMRDMGPRPSQEHSVDRIDNNGPYCKDNCRWATRAQQNNNSRHNVLLSFNGETRNISEWARHLGVSFSLIASRIKYGWCTERVLSVPVRKHESNAK